MKIVRFEQAGNAAYGVLEGDRIQTLAGEPFTELARTGASVPAADVRLLAPVDPPNVLAIGLNYRPHADESNMKIPDHPILFIKATTSVVGPADPIVLPAIAPDEIDYEAELAVVIGREARHVPREQALNYVFGYTCGNDVSARDCQLKLDGQWARGKSFDTFCPLGPYIETDLNPGNLAVRCRLNGETMQDGNSSDLVFDCAELIAFLSRCMTLRPGTVLMTGTPAGVGFSRRPQVFLQAGDTVEVEVEGIGILTNPVVNEKVG